MDKSKIKYLFLGLILITSIFLRLHKLPDRMVFDWDQERDAFAVNTIINEHKPLLIGPRVMNDSGFMLGPYFFYILAPFYLITNFSPYANVTFIGIYSAIFFIFSFFTIKKLISEKTAILFCSIWSLLPLAINIDTIAWNPLLVPFFIILFIDFLGKLPPLKKTTWLILGLIIGLGINIHVQLIVLALWLFFYFADKKSIKTIFQYSPFIIIGILITFIPLLIFDLRHNWLNLHLVLNFIQTTNVQKHGLSFLPVWNNFVYGLTYINFPIFSILFWVIIGIILLFFAKNSKIIKSIALVWFTWPIIFILYGKRPSEYYFNFTLPLIVLAFSLLLSKIIKSNLIIFILFIILSSISINNKIKNPGKTPFSLTNKMKVAEFIKTKVADQKFNLSYSVPSGYNSGYEYLLKVNKANPTNNPSDPLIQIVIPPVSDNIVFGGIGIQLPQTFLH